MAINPLAYVGIGVGGVVVLLFLVWLICKYRRSSRYDYTALREERSLIQKWEEEKRTQKIAERVDISG